MFAGENDSNSPGPMDKGISLHRKEGFPFNRVFFKTFAQCLFRTGSTQNGKVNGPFSNRAVNGNKNLPLFYLADKAKNVRQNAREEAHQNSSRIKAFPGNKSPKARSMTFLAMGSAIVERSEILCVSRTPMIMVKKFPQRGFEKPPRREKRSLARGLGSHL